MERDIKNIMYETERTYLVPFNRDFIYSMQEPLFKKIETQWEKLETYVNTDPSLIHTRYFEWWTNPKVTEFNSHGLFPKNKDGFESFFNAIDKGEYFVLAIIEKKTLIHVGNISLQSFNWINRSAEYAIVIGEPYYHGKGFAAETTKKLFHHGFNKLNLHRIWTGTSSANVGMQKVALKLGMTYEGTFREGMFQNGKYEDIFSYGILQREWKL